MAEGVRATADGTAPSGRFSGSIPPIAWWFLFLMTADNVLGVIDRNAVSILKPTIKSVFRISDSDYGLLVTAFMVPYAIFYIVTGRLVDQYGSRITLTVFVLIWSTATMASAFAPDFQTLLGLRVVLGAAEAGLLPATMFALVTWFPRDRLATIYAIKTPLQSMGPILTPPVVAGLALAYGWQAAFLVPGALGLLFALLWWQADRNPPDYGEPVPQTAASLRVALAGLLADRRLWVVIALRFITDPVWFFFQYWQAGYLQEVLGASLATTGRILWIPPLVTCVLTFGTAAISDRLVHKGWPPAFSRVRVMQATVFCAPLIALIPFVNSVTFFLIAVTTTFFMCFTWLYLSNILVADLFTKSGVGSAIGFVNCIGTIGAAGFNLAAGPIIEAQGYATVFLILAALHPIATIVTLLSFHRTAGAR